MTWIETDCESSGEVVIEQIIYFLYIKVEAPSSEIVFLTRADRWIFCNKTHMQMEYKPGTRTEEELESYILWNSPCRQSPGLQRQRPTVDWN
jgi:hypothetical protein